MHRPSVFLALALLASFALVSPAHAGSIVETVGQFTLTGGGKATELDFSYSSGVLPPVGDVVTVNSTTFTSLSHTVVGSTIEFTFTATASGSIDFTFESPSDPGDVYLPTTETSGITGRVTGNSTEGHLVGVTFVPEPSSLALLGIGMAGYFTYRRVLKRSAMV